MGSGKPGWLTCCSVISYTFSPAAGREALALVPSDASVVAQAAIAPHLSQRELIYMLDGTAPDADYVVAADPLNPWPLASPDAIRELVDARRAAGYQTVFERDGWVVLRR